MQFVFLGPPGAGKGTQAILLAERWRIPHISTGDILRQAIAGKTSLGIQARQHVEAGELVPDILVMALIRERFGEPDIQSGWILDGFPRTVPQANALDELLGIVQQPHPTVIYFEVTTEQLVERMLDRARLDDTEETIRRRLEVYQEDTAPLIDFYERRNCLKTINGNPSLDEVAHSLQESLLQYQCSALV
ncbi:MAG: adenylate kinase [Leptolyngbya sp. SIO1D8]|nr:adenylate kinase [Leptolyngbya sp. SIO1D8]